MDRETLIIVTARNEADRIAATLQALAGTFRQARVWVADDGSADDTAARARDAGATVVSTGRRLGKGGAATLAARQALAAATPGGVVLLCDGDLGDSAALLGPLVDAVREGRADLAVAAFARRVGGGLGLALGFARWAIKRRCGIEAKAPISGQRAIGAGALAQLLPFAAGFGMEIGMTVAAARAGLSMQEIEIDLSHRATGRTAGGFLHRGRQLRDFIVTYRRTAR